MNIIKVRSGSPYEEKASYSRAIVVDNLIYVSNTAGRNPTTGQIPEDFTEQALQVFENIEKALATVDCSLNDVIFSRVYVQNSQDIPAAIEVLGNKFRSIDPATSVTCPPLGALYYKIEIEVTAYRGASRLTTEIRFVSD